MNLFSRLSAVPGAGKQIRNRYRVEDPRLQVELFGLKFPNPIGLAAGFDKEGKWFHPLANLGFGSIEIGTVTGQAQPGNPKPRMFRLPRDKALINRMGFNSEGCESVAQHLRRNKNRTTSGSVLGINIGKSKVIELEDAPAEYQKGLEKLFPFADYITINVSSPNTPNLRQLQGRDHLIAIIEAVNESNQRQALAANVSPRPILLKIAPDLSNEQIEEIAEVAISHSLQGVIATNTTISRSGLHTPAEQIESIGAGGLSGRPLTRKSREVVALLYRHLKNEIPIIGVGGIMGGEDAWKMITAGASLVQLYTGFIYGGPTLIRDMNLHLLERISQHKFASISEAVGTENAQTEMV